MKFYLATVEGHRTLEHRKDEARKISPDFEQIDIPTDMPGLKAYVQQLFNDIYDLEQQLRDRGEDYSEFMPERAPPIVPTPVQPSLVHRSIADDDEFNALPLARQLHFAAMAMENAREKI